MKAVGIVGRSGAGKTSLVESLVPRLDGQVATVKSIHHAVEIDDPGADTHRHRTAGAEKVVGVTPALTVAVEPGGKDDFGDDWPALRRVLAELAADGFDAVLVEGFTASPLPKVVVGEPPADLAGPVIERLADVGGADLDTLATAVSEVDDWSTDTAAR